ncbi:leucine permease transcriptional regulator [Niveomyces insectorum RCEF 264]|uniref:Leucine permease transcriptional regulator n=1 Tax=Niveomyces insectorum RCEF 264 TaxID=1081102 RepID=A0A167M5U1_9HYPO|nr:leucine permease transcriptional regulator [Niveomyces insectorum RCEF 264]
MSSPRNRRQLQKDKLKPPPWPKEPGNPDNRSVMESFRESYKKYRDKVRASLIKAGLIDNPEVRKRLDEAIDFKGICEDMCPEFEKISRIVQYDVKMPEKTEGADGTMWPFPRLMVKALARSAAGQEAPLPMDVRSVTSLKRTLNYLIDTLLGDDSRLPSMHNFLWDRTRAIRRDFVFHSTMSDEEMLNQVYCLENITRFHATALHLLSQKGFAAEDFSEQQEREQLGKALLSLMQAYDDCKEKEVTCENEAEFRAYFILLNAHDPDFQNKVSEWGTRFWHDSDDVQTALTLVQAMQSVWDWRGPIKPSIPTTTSLGAFSSFFRIVETSKVSYTMACFAEIHFVHVRRGILRNVTRAYSRIRDSPRDLTVAVLNAMLRFDTDKEAFEFATQHGLEFSSNNTADAYLVLERTAHITSVPTVRQSFSWSLVERKRGNRQLPEVIRTTVFEDTTTLSLSQKDNANRSIFVDQTTPTEAHFGIRDDNSVKKALGKTTNATSDIPDAVERLDAYTTPFSPFPFASTSSNFAAPVKSSATFSTPSPSVSNSDQVTPVKQNQASVAAASLVPKHSFNIEAQPSSASVDDIFRPFSSVTSSPSTVPNILPTPDFALTASKGLQLAKDKTSDIFGHPAASHTRLTSSQKTKESDPSSHLTARTSSSSLLAPTASTTSSTPEIFSRNASSETGAQESHTLDLTSASTVEKREETEVSKQKHASTGDETTTSSMASPPRLQGPVFQKVAPKVAARTTAKVSRMDNFNKWFTLGDGGILDEFRVALVQHLVTQTLNLFVGEKVERQQREEDQKSWAEARSFKTYNLRIKFFYRWQHVARERALDRRARQARDEMRAYRSARLNEQRLAADKTTAEEHEKAAEARQMTSKEVKFLEELGYYGDFSVTSRRQKSSAASEKLTVPLSNQDSDNKETTAMAGNLFAAGVLCGARHEDGSTALVVQEDASPSSDAQHILNKKREQEQRAQRQQKRLPVRQSSKQDMTRTASRTKDFFTSEAFINTKRERSTFGSAAKESVDGDGLHSSLRSSHSPDSPKVAYYRRSMRSKGRLHGIFTRVSPKPNTDKANAAHEGMTNFMRYSNKQLSSPGNQAVGSTGGHIFVKDDDLWRGSSPSLSSVSASAAGSQNMSNMRSGYWRLRAMGLVQMPNKQFLHESLALPMLQNGKRFSGVGSYGLPPPGPKSHDSENDHPDNTPPGLAANAGDDSEECLGEERQMSIFGSSNGVLLSRKRLFSGSSYASQHRYSDESRRDGRAAGAVTSPPGVKKAKTRELQLSQRPEQQQNQLDETERVIQEMRETADAMDQGRNWFVEQTKLMENGATIWDQ